jgi:sulfite reductase beta subunit-like hemoprotein
MAKHNINQQENFLSLLAAPAKRALENNGIDTLEKLSQFTEKEVLQFHGIGKSAIPKLHNALHAAGLSFKNNISS